MVRYHRFLQKKDMRRYTKIALVISAVICVIILSLTICNVPKYKLSSSQEVTEKETLMKNVKLMETTDSIILNVADSIVSNTSNIIETCDSMEVHINSASDELENINKSVRNVRLR